MEPVARRALRLRCKPLRSCRLDAELGRNAGVLIAGSGHTDAIDAALVALADHGDQIITSDPGDLSILAATSNRRINVVPV